MEQLRPLTALELQPVVSLAEVMRERAAELAGPRLRQTLLSGPSRPVLLRGAYGR